MNQINCIIVDDEPIARQIIENYCIHLPYLNIIASCQNALEAKSVVANHKIDLLFLDINMPVLDGMAFVKTLRQPPQIIFTTAYKEYAVEAFDLVACDYLLKPFSLERFIKAVDRAEARIFIEHHHVSTAIESASDYTFIKSDGKIYRIEYQDILYAEAFGNFTKLHLTDSILMPSFSFTAIQELLSEHVFIRVHRSFIINKFKITHIEGNRIFIGKIEIPIGNIYKDSFFKSIQI